MKKLVLLLAVLLTLTFAFPAAAEEALNTEITTEAVTTTAPVTDAPVTAPPTTAEDPAEEPEKTLIDEISGVIKEYMPSLLSSAVLVLSAVLTYLFKKGLVPGISRSLGVIDQTVTGYKEDIKGFLAKLGEENEALREFSEKLLSRISEKESELTNALNAGAKILLAQSDSLFDLLEHTNLPAQTKAEIAAKHKAQIEEITKLVGGANDKEA